VGEDAAAFKETVRKVVRPASKSEGKE